MKISFNSINSNIGHFLHQELQYLLDLIFKNDQSIEIFLPNYISTDNQYRWHYGIFNILKNKNDKCTIIFTNNIPTDCHIINSGHPMIIDIAYIEYLRKIVFEYYSIPCDTELKPYKVLYTRTHDTDRRHLLNSNCVKNNFNLIINSLNISFEEQVRLFSKLTHFVSVESGAHFVNIMFMQPSAKVMNILTRTDFSTADNRIEKYDSWQCRFGTSKLIKEFNLDTKATSRVKCSNGAACGDFDMHNHVYIDDKLKKSILDWIN